MRRIHGGGKCVEDRKRTEVLGKDGKRKGREDEERQR